MIPRTLAVILSAILVLAPVAGMAEQQGPASLSDVQPTPGLTAETVTEAQIDSFIEALVMIRRVGANYTPRIDAETDGAKRKEIIAQANLDIINAVRFTADISPADYVAIDRASQQDPDLNTKIVERMKVLAENGTGKIITRQP